MIQNQEPSWGGCKFAAAAARVAIVLICGLTAGGVLAEDICGPGNVSKPVDLTGMSLNDLYNLDIVQPNVLGGHTHPQGQMMLGYSYMHTSMSGLYQGTHEISPAAAFAQGFGTVHTDMEMNMHMFEFMYAPTERLTLMAMLPYEEMSMSHLKDTGVTFGQSARGIGDVDLAGLYTIFGNIREGGHRLVFNAGVSLPTGSIDVTDHANGSPGGAQVPLEYLMRLGSGTYDLKPGLTYLGDYGAWSWGAQTVETVRLGLNSHDYRLGNEYRLSAWASYGITEWFAPSIRLDGRWWENIKGADPDLAANTTPEARPNLRAGKRLDLLFGLNLYSPHGTLKGNRLMVEGGIPVYQNLTGPQLGTAWMLTVGWSYAF